MGGGYWLCFLPSYQHLFLHPGLKHTAWHLQTPNHTVPVTVCAAGREMTCSYIYQLSSKSLQMFRKLLAEWQLSVAISWKVILVSKQLIKKALPSPCNRTYGSPALSRPLPGYVVEKWLHSPPQPHFSGMALSLLAANSKRKLAWLLPCSSPKKRWMGGKEQSFQGPCKVLCKSLQGPFHPPPAIDSTAWSKEKGCSMAELGTGRQVTRDGTGKTLGTACK